ncbi:MAG TPA: TIR domain-containing protein [Thermoguttaceae bacterium]|nr:TIR domain-containing protein [Thermoguttaceae bacterium]
MGTRCAAGPPKRILDVDGSGPDIAQADFDAVDVLGDEAPDAALSRQTGAQFRSQAGAEASHPVDENVQFSVYRPKVVQPERSYPLLAFAHLAERRPDAPKDEPDPIQEVQRQARLVLEEKFDEYGDVRQDGSEPLPHLGEITFVPEIPGVRFNPSSRSFFWEREESVHREEFRLRASPQLDGQTARGRLTVFLGNVIVAEVALAIRVDSSHRAEPSALPTDLAFGRPYRRIFASYSHEDVAIVEEFEWHFKSVGDRYLRDWIDLRAGEAWCERLEELIREADVFQLFWSTKAMRSPFVRQEWEYALALGRPYFIRPVYWEEPMPSDPDEDLPPEALLRLHFQRLPSAGGPHAPPTRSAPAEIEAACPECSTCYRVSVDYWGAEAECPQCGAMFTIGGASAEPAVRTRGEPPPKPGSSGSEEVRRRQPPDAEREQRTGTTDLQGCEPAEDAPLPPSPAEKALRRERDRPPSRRTSTAQISEDTSPVRIPDRYRPPVRTSTAQSGEGPARRSSPIETIAPVGCVVSILLVGAYLAYRLIIALLSLFS